MHSRHFANKLFNYVVSNSRQTLHCNMILKQMASLKQNPKVSVYIRSCLNFFKSHSRYVIFIIFVLTAASFIYCFGEFCCIAISKALSFPFILEIRTRRHSLDVPVYIYPNAEQKNTAVLRGPNEIRQAELYIQKKEHIINLQTRALERRMKELVPRYEKCAPFLTEERARDLINEALMLYDSDKLGLRDYALESAGGSIISTPSTRPCKTPLKYIIFSYFIFTSYSNPRAIIQPDIKPGNCFQFEGSQGRIRIKLANKIYVTGITLDNSPSNLLTDEEELSTPKTFQVIGLENENSADGLVLGEFIYSVEGPSTQTFLIKDNVDYPAFEFVELFIVDNYGNYVHTCVYRFRVHGRQW